MEMTRQCVLSPLEKPGHRLCLEHWSSGMLKDLLSAASGSCTVTLRNEQEERQTSESSTCSRPVGARHLTSTGAPLLLFGQSKGCGASRRSLCSSCSHTSSDTSGRGMTLLGSPIGLWPRPISTPKRGSLDRSSRVKLPQLAKGGSAQDRNSARKLCILTAIKPSNVEIEKIKFFKSDFMYNPQFQYSSPVSPQVLEKHNTASDRFLTQAVRIMELALLKYGTYENFEQATGGNLLSKSRIWSHVKKYMEKEGCVGEIVVHVTDDLLSRGSMTVVNGRPTLTINMSTARKHWLEGLLRHEIGTHYFRGINNSQQSWGSGAGRRRLGLRPFNPTEEGLASIHSLLFRRDPLMWRAALLYYTVHQASRASFSQLFRDLGRFVRDPATRWDYCVRAKRGQTDTSQPGCFSKDQVYLDGILKILRHRERIDFQLLIALGKVSYEDVDWLKDLAVMEHVRIPHFLQDQVRYTEQLHKIMEVNHLTDEELCALI